MVLLFALIRFDFTVVKTVLKSVETCKHFRSLMNVTNTKYSSSIRLGVFSCETQTVP